MIKQLLLWFSALLLAGGFALVWDSPPESFLRQQKPKVNRVSDADSYMTGVTSYRYNHDGARNLTIHSPRLEFYQRGKSVQLSDPQVNAITQNGEKITLTASYGQYVGEANQLSLYQKVNAVVAGKQGDTTMNSSQMEYDVDRNTISIADQFTLQTPASTVSGRGLQAELNQQSYKIKADVRATHDPAINHN